MKFVLQRFTRQRPAGKLLGHGRLTLSPSKVVSKPSLIHCSVYVSYHASFCLSCWCLFPSRWSRLFAVVVENRASVPREKENSDGGGQETTSRKITLVGQTNKRRILARDEVCDHTKFRAGG